MPTTNIHWIKLFLSLFDEDDRFLFQLNESQQLLYVKLLMLAGRTYNQIVKRPKFICSKVNYPHEEECFLKDINRIMEVFPKFKSNEKFYYFENFHELHNQIQDDKWGIRGKETAWKGDGLIQNGLSQIKNKIKIKNKIEEPLVSIGGLSLKTSFLTNLKTTYPMLKVDSEVLACIAWHKSKGRDVKSWDRAIRNWLKNAYERVGVVGGEAKGGVSWNTL